MSGRPLFALATLALLAGCTKQSGDEPASTRADDSAAIPIDAAGAGAARAKATGPVDHGTLASTLDRQLIIRGVTSTHRHDHGGKPARIGTATFEVINKRSRPRPLALEQVEAIRARGCPRKPWKKGKPIKHTGLRLASDKSYDVHPVIDVPPGIHRVRVGFELVDAYQSWCNVFGFRAHFASDGERLAAVADARVVRVTPLRR